jgi:hypothetical protein
VKEGGKNRWLLAAVLGLELSLLTLGVYTLLNLTERGFHPVDTWQLFVLVGAMIVIYLMYLKKETAVAEDRALGEKYRTGALLEAVPVPAMMLDADGTVLGANALAAGALEVDELALTAAQVSETPGGELGARLATGGAGHFEARTAAGRSLRCTAAPIGGAAGAEARLVILEVPPPERAPGGVVQVEARGLVRRCAETVTPVLERSSDHLASLAAAARLASPHEAGRAAQLAGVAVRLLQAARRVRLAEQTVLIRHGELAGALRPQVFDCTAVAAGVVGRLKSLCAATGVELVSSVPDGPLNVDADRDRISLVLRDLLEVCLAMTAAGGEVSLKMTGGDREVEIAVTDNGVGMSPEELESLFSTSGSAPVHEDYTGGIRDGLFVAKEIVEASGGQLWAESAPGRGTRFNVRIPMA